MLVGTFSGELKELSCLAKLPLAEGEEEPAPAEGEEDAVASTSALGKDLNGGAIVNVHAPVVNVLDPNAPNVEAEIDSLMGGQYFAPFAPFLLTPFVS